MHKCTTSALHPASISAPQHLCTSSAPAPLHLCSSAPLLLCSSDPLILSSSSSLPLCTLHLHNHLHTDTAMEQIHLCTYLVAPPYLHLCTSAPLYLHQVSVTKWLELEVALVKGWIPFSFQNLTGLLSRQYLFHFSKERLQSIPSFREMVLNYIDVSSPYVVLCLDRVFTPCLMRQVQSI